MRLAVCAFVGVFTAVGPLMAQSLVPPIAGGDMKIAVTTAPAVAGSAIAIFSVAGAGPCSAAATSVPLAPSVAAVVGAGTTTTIALAGPLAGGTTVCAVISPAAGGAAWTTPGVAVAQAPSIIPVPNDGDTRIALTTAPAKEGDTIAVFSAAPSPSATPPTCSASSTAVPLAANTSNSVLQGTQTAVVLKDPLSQGQVICAVISSAGIQHTTPSVTVGAPASPPGFDWGLIRAYFTLGGLTSEADSEFSHEDLFLAFDLDKAYVRLHKDSNPDNYGHRIGFNSFFETRLTALPVAVQSCSQTSTATCSNSGTVTSTTSSNTTTAAAFLNSQKSARLLFGIYAPIPLHEWHVASRSGSQTIQTPYALFIAPLIKTGFDTTLNGLNQTQQNSSTPSAVQPVGTSSEFYKFYDYGFRVGHYEMASDPDVAPTTLSYLDVSVGRFSNLASLLCPAASYTGNNTCNVAAGSLPWARDTRLNVEGLLQVPATNGFSIGFSTNVVFDPFHLQGDSHIIHIRPADDLRFLFAYKFDISKLAALLAPRFSN